MEPGAIIALVALIVTIVIAVGAAAWAISRAISSSVGRVHTRLDALASQMSRNADEARDRSDDMKKELLEKIDQGDRHLADRVTAVEGKISEHLRGHPRHGDTTALIKRSPDHA